MSDHAGKRIHVLLKSCRALTLVPQLHLSLPRAKLEAPEILDSQYRFLRPSDSVRLAPKAPCPRLFVVAAQRGHALRALATLLLLRQKLPHRPLRLVDGHM